MPHASASSLPTLLGPREITVVALAPNLIRIDVQSDEDEHDRAALIRDVAYAQRVIADLQRAVYEAMRMQP